MLKFQFHQTLCKSVISLVSVEYLTFPIVQVHSVPQPIYGYLTPHPTLLKWSNSDPLRDSNSIFNDANDVNQMINWVKKTYTEFAPQSL
jgi:hypothetical protein